MLELVRALKIEFVITLGGLLADTPHTRPVPVTGTADGEMATARSQPLELRGPDRDRRRAARRVPGGGVPSASLWAAVPHYISVSPNPKAALALIDRLGALLETHFQTMELGQAAVRFERQVTSAVASDEDVSTYVRDLEKRMDAGEEPLRDLPTGDELAAELQRFLSDRGQEPGDAPEGE